MKPWAVTGRTPRVRAVPSGILRRRQSRRYGITASGKRETEQPEAHEAVARVSLDLSYRAVATAWKKGTFWFMASLAHPLHRPSAWAEARPLPRLPMGHAPSRRGRPGSAASQGPLWQKALQEPSLAWDDGSGHGRRGRGSGTVSMIPLSRRVVAISARFSLM